MRKVGKREKRKEEREMRYLVCLVRDGDEPVEPLAIFRKESEAKFFQSCCIFKQHRYNKPSVVYVVDLKICHTLKNNYYSFENLVKLTGSAFEARTVLILLQAIDQKVEKFARQYIETKKEDNFEDT